MTNPEKNALIQLMIKVCGIIIIMLPFIIFIMASMPAGSAMGLAGAWPRFSGSLRNAPFLYALIKYVLRVSNDSRGST